ncbi:MAG TPA: hypothetical protein VJ779_05215 [Acetobacteraceae bacterium]|nr:hypothetical protein [Acetobacteraceae bacterium]
MPYDNAVPATPFRVDQIIEGQNDGRGVTIARVFAFRSGQYAIYLARDITVQYSDDPKTETEQRKRVLAIGEARADLDTLLFGWSRERRKAYDAKIASALQLAIEGEELAARKMIESARSDALKEREAAGRMQYLLCTASICVLLMLMLAALYWLGAIFVSDPANDFGLAAGAALAGAAFSIVLAIRSRTVAPDLNLLGNFSDSALRVAIGLLSGVLLLLLLSSGVLPKLSFGDADLSAAKLTWKGVLVLGFVAGFVERMVPDLLDKARPESAGAPASATH